MLPCPNLEHDDFDVLPAERNGHCLFICFVNILRERGVEGAPANYQAMRRAIADYFDEHSGKVLYQEEEYPCDDEIRTNGYGGLTEIMAFAMMYNISIEIHSPETTENVQPITCGSSNSPELLLHTLGWEDAGRRAAAGDHWQRLRTNIDVEQQVGAVPAVAALAQIDVGARVLIHDIVERPEFNDCIGKVVAPFNTEKQRWHVHVRPQTGDRADAPTRRTRLTRCKVHQRTAGSEQLTCSCYRAVPLPLHLPLPLPRPLPLPLPLVVEESLFH
jgi:hypothetical protein